MTINRYVCVHGHFYQPPRDNPFTGELEEQQSAAPHTNWNVRITAESYAPNADARLLDDAGDLVKTVNNYELISFDFGPTLLSWMAKAAPDTYAAVIDADRASAARFGGHGSAMAQSYNHTILPLSNHRDRVTQVKWGIADFRHRFGRDPDGIWLPETAVDNETLRIAAAEGIRFTVLAQHQAAEVEDESGQWIDARDGKIDTSVAYRADLGDDSEMAVFFYDGPLSREIAFDGLLKDGHLLARKLMAGARVEGSGPRLSHVATDGETYGHHHEFGEMALAAALEEILAAPDVKLTNYSEFLALHPPSRMVRVADDTSWSCAHGVERWRSDCGCSTGGEAGWDQSWREPLRRALDYLRGEVGTDFDDLGRSLLRDPWAARNDFIEVVLGADGHRFIMQQANSEMGDESVERALGLLEIQHRAMLMYTSCGWFFNDITGLESIFVLRHAGRVIDLTRRIVGRDLEPEFLRILSSARSNIGGITGADVYRREVTPYMRHTVSS